MDPLLLMSALVAVILIIFGPKKIPELARSFGIAKKEFEKGANEKK